MGRGTPPPVSLIKTRNMKTHNTQAQQSNAAPATNAMNTRNERLRLGKQPGYRITEAMTTGTGQRREEPLNASRLENSTVSGGQRKHGKNARKSTRPNGLLDNCGVKDSPTPWSGRGVLA